MKGDNQMFSNDAPIMSMMKKKMGWLSQRQSVLAQNVANADSPNYVGSDLKPFTFREEIGKVQARIPVSVTSENHIEGPRNANDAFESNELRKRYETSPDGNGVNLEEQLIKVGETQMDHELVTQLYAKYHNMFKIAIGRGR